MVAKLPFLMTYATRPNAYSLARQHVISVCLLLNSASLGFVRLRGLNTIGRENIFPNSIRPGNHFFMLYITFSVPHLENKEQILSLGLATIVTPEDAVTHIKARTADVPVELFTMMLMPPGAPITSAQTSLELFAKKVIPHFQ